MAENQTNNLVKGAFLLTLAGLISKVLSAGYRIPLQNLTGDIGFYVYQQIYPLLGMVIILSLYGFPSAISKITAEMSEDGKNHSLRSFYLPLLLIMIGISGGLFILLYTSAQTVAIAIGDEGLETTYQLAAFAFLLIPVTSLLRGSFQGNMQMKPTAYSQIGEQLVRVLLIILIAYLFSVQAIGLYKISEYAVVASIMGASTAIIILLIFFIKLKPINHLQYKVPWGYYFRMIFTLGIVASFNHMVLLIIQFADVFTLVPGLVQHGLSNIEAMEAKGVFDRGQPLIQLGTVLGSSFALALIPAISKQRLAAAPEKFRGYIEGVLLFSFYLAAGAVIGLVMIVPETNTLLFQNTKGTVSLRILSIAIFLSSISITGASVLQGLGYFKRSAGMIVGAFLIKWVANKLLVPIWGINGSAAATVISLLALCMVIFVELKRKVPALVFMKQINLSAFGKASACMVVYIVVIRYLIPYETIQSRLLLLLYVAWIALTGAIIYFYILLKGRAFTKEELTLLPYSTPFIKIHRGRERIEK